MVENGNYTEPNYGDTPYPDDGTPWLDTPTSNQVLGVEEMEEISTVPSEMIPTGTGGEYLPDVHVPRACMLSKTIIIFFTIHLN